MALVARSGRRKVRQKTTPVAVIHGSRNERLDSPKRTCREDRNCRLPRCSCRRRGRVGRTLDQDGAGRRWQWRTPTPRLRLQGDAIAVRLRSAPRKPPKPSPIVIALIVGVTGAPVAAFAAFDEVAVTFTPDQGRKVAASPGVTRTFCAVCGSPQTGRYDYLPGQVYIAVGILD
jgi:hypothetical protein